MTLEEIKSAIDAGQTVHWANTGYCVHRDSLGQYLITFQRNGSTIGLTDRSGQRLNGEEAEFFIACPEGGDGPDHCRHPRPDGRGIARGLSRLEQADGLSRIRTCVLSAALHPVSRPARLASTSG